MVSIMGKETERFKIEIINHRCSKYYDRFIKDVNTLAIALRSLLMETSSLSQPTQETDNFLAHPRQSIRHGSVHVQQHIVQVNAVLKQPRTILFKVICN